MTRLIIHAGTHKTGTTSLQHVLANSAELLAEHGVLYPNRWDIFYRTPPEEQSRNAHFALARAIAQMGENQQRSIQRFLAVLNQAKENFHTIILSSESIYRHFDEVGPQDTSIGERQRRYLGRMQDLFSGYDTEVVLMFRRPDLFAESLYGEVIANSPKANTFVETIRNQSHFFNYQDRIDMFEEYFQVRPLNFENARADGLIRFFFSNLQIPADIPEPGLLRTSLLKHSVLWMARAKSENPEISEQARKRRWLFALQKRHADLFKGNGGEMFWDSVEHRDTFLNSSISNLRSLKFETIQMPSFKTCLWDDESHQRAENAYKKWLEKNLEWVEAREGNKIAPFSDPEGDDREASPGIASAERKLIKDSKYLKNKIS